MFNSLGEHDTSMVVKFRVVDFVYQYTCHSEFASLMLFSLLDLIDNRWCRLPTALCAMKFVANRIQLKNEQAPKFIIYGFLFKIITHLYDIFLNFSVTHNAASS